MLRPWENRFGARLIDVGFADIRLLVERPPRTLAAAQRIAAEHVVLADECIDGFREVRNVAARLVNSPIWTFWWAGVLSDTSPASSSGSSPADEAIHEP